MRSALFRAKQSRLDAMEGEAGQRLTAAALAVIGALLRPACRSLVEPSAAGRLKLPLRRAASEVPAVRHAHFLRPTLRYARLQLRGRPGSNLRGR